MNGVIGDVVFHQEPYDASGLVLRTRYRIGGERVPGASGVKFAPQLAYCSKNDR